MNEQIKKDREFISNWTTPLSGECSRDVGCIEYEGVCMHQVYKLLEAQARVTTAELIDELFEFSLPIEVVSFLQNKLSN